MEIASKIIGLGIFIVIIYVIARIVMVEFKHLDVDKTTGDMR